VAVSSSVVTRTCCCIFSFAKLISSCSNELIVRVSSRDLLKGFTVEIRN